MKDKHVTPPAVFVLEEKIDERDKIIEQQKESLRLAYKALGFYGDRNSWRYEEINDCDARIIQEDLSIPDVWCEENGGKTARQAIKQLEEKHEFLSEGKQ